MCGWLSAAALSGGVRAAFDHLRLVLHYKDRVKLYPVEQTCPLCDGKIIMRDERRRKWEEETVAYLMILYRHSIPGYPVASQSLHSDTSLMQYKCLCPREAHCSVG